MNTGRGSFTGSDTEELREARTGAGMAERQKRIRFDGVGSQVVRAEGINKGKETFSALYHPLF